MFKINDHKQAGFKAVDVSDLRYKVDEGAGAAAPHRDYPRVSVLYHPAAADAGLFNLSVSTVLQHLPFAFEVVVVVANADATFFEGIVEPYRASAAIPLRVFGEPAVMEAGIQRQYSTVR